MVVGSFFDELEAMPAPQREAAGAPAQKRVFDRDKRKQKAKMAKQSKKANRKKR